MTASVLGKRSRSTLDTPQTERAKKRTPFVIASDENINPFVTKPAPHTPNAPSTPSTPRAGGQSTYNKARNILKQSSGKLIGRDAERAELRTFLSTRLAARKSGCLYVSGPPGTGKSALVTEVLNEPSKDSRVKVSIVNCMSVKNAAGICAKLLEDFDQFDVLQGGETSALQALFHTKHATHLVVLDEIDHLLGVDLELLYKIFHWSLQKTSNLILVGIANALDFTDRFLPRLRSKGLKPQLLPFMPYTVTQIASVIATKLKSTLPQSTTQPAGFVPFIHPTAIQFASKKVAAQTGDLRKAFSICLRVIDLIELEARTKASTITPSPSPSPCKRPLAENKKFSPSKTPLMENMNLSSPPRAIPTDSKPPTPSIRKQISDPLSTLTPETAPRATIAHMARVTASVFSNGTSSRLASLNLQQKAALCALCALESKHRSQRRSPLDSIGNPVTPSKKDTQPSAPTVKKLFDTYSRLCKRENVLHPLSNTEFRDVIESLEALSLVAVMDGRNGSLTPSRTPSGTPSRRGRGATGFGKVGVEEKRVASCVGGKEVRDCLDGPGAGILRALIDGEGL